MITEQELKQHRLWYFGEGGVQINRVGSDLSGSDLRGASLSKANLSEANLAGANMREAYLSKADLNEANLAGANLMGANLTGANLMGAYLGRTDLSEANLTGSDLRGANMREANMREANLMFVDLTGSDLRGANLTDANLTGSDLREANLNDAVGLWEVERQITEAARIYSLLQIEGNLLEMEDWHTCETAHCIAGWSCPDNPNPGAEASRKMPLIARFFFSENDIAKKALYLLGRGLIDELNNLGHTL